MSTSRVYTIGVPMAITVTEHDSGAIEVRLDVDLAEAAGRDLEPIEGYAEDDINVDSALIAIACEGMRNNLSVNLSATR